MKLYMAMVYVDERPVWMSPDIFLSKEEAWDLCDKTSLVIKEVMDAHLPTHRQVRSLIDYATAERIKANQALDHRFGGESASYTHEYRSTYRIGGNDSEPEYILTDESDKGWHSLGYPMYTISYDVGSQHIEYKGGGSLQKKVNKFEQALAEYAEEDAKKTETEKVEVQVKNEVRVIENPHKDKLTEFVCGDLVDHISYLAQAHGKGKIFVSAGEDPFDIPEPDSHLPKEIPVTKEPKKEHEIVFMLASPLLQYHFHNRYAYQLFVNGILLYQSKHLHQSHANAHADMKKQCRDMCKKIGEKVRGLKWDDKFDENDENSCEAWQDCAIIYSAVNKLADHTGTRRKVLGSDGIREYEFKYRLVPYNVDPFSDD